MSVAKQTMWLLATLAILAYSGWHYAHLNNLAQMDTETLSITPDSTVTKLNVKQFSAEGILINQLTTPLMHHIPKKNIHLLQTPHIIISQADQPSWEIYSLKAKSLDGGKKITFIKQVVVHQNQDKKTLESTLKTEKVTYFPKEKKATTNLFVTFEQPGNIVESTGMNAYLDEKRIELLHQARGRYAPANG